MATISEIARRAGVGVSTVSRYLNDHPYISEEKKERIQAAIDDLNYTPSAIATQLRNQSTVNVGILVSRITNPFFTRYIDEVERDLHRNGYQVMVSQTYNDEAIERAFLEKLKSREIEAVIMASVESPETVEQIAREVPHRIVALNQTFAGTAVHTVNVDHYSPTKAALEHLWDRGARSIAYVTGGSFSGPTHGNDRNQAFRDFKEHHGIKPATAIIYNHRHTISDGAELATKIADLPDARRPDAVFANSDEVAIGLIGGLIASGIQVPEDIAVIGYDDQPMAPYVRVPLTTIRQPVEQMAQLTVTRLLNALGKATEPGPVADLTPQLIIRESA